MSAYVIVDTKIKNPSVYEEYKKLAKPIAEKYGGVYKARGGNIDLIENTLWTPTRIVIVEFPDVKAARNFIDSKEYAPIKLLRTENADCTLFILDAS